MKPFAFKKARVGAEALTQGLSFEEMAEAKGAGGARIVRSNDIQ